MTPCRDSLPPDSAVTLGFSVPAPPAPQCSRSISRRNRSGSLTQSRASTRKGIVDSRTASSKSIRYLAERRRVSMFTAPPSDSGTPKVASAIAASSRALAAQLTTCDVPRYTMTRAEECDGSMPRRRLRPVHGRLRPGDPYQGRSSPGTPPISIAEGRWRALRARSVRRPGDAAAPGRAGGPEETGAETNHPLRPPFRRFISTMPGVSRDAHRLGARGGRDVLIPLARKESAHHKAADSRR